MARLLCEYDISALQNIPRPTMNGLCRYIQGDVEIERIEIAKVKEPRRPLPLAR